MGYKRFLMADLSELRKKHSVCKKPIIGLKIELTEWTEWTVSIIGS